MSGREGPYERHLAASTTEQRESLAEQRVSTKYALYQGVTPSCRDAYFAISCRPITKVAEDDMEIVSDVVTGTSHPFVEGLTNFFEVGVYRCARCRHAVYRSEDKWSGPCVWPSFRRGACENSLSTARVLNYNAYECAVDEVYCGECDLFLGHRFEDGIHKGDTHPDAHWRH